jgi:cell division protein FtsI/penicillin-binding protein 2/cell division protein FtsW (lipid II flippase)
MSILKQSTLKETPQARKIELRLLIVTAILLLFGLGYIYLVKTQKPLNFAELPEMMQVREVEENGKKIKKLPEIVNFKELKKKEDWLPYLTKFEDKEDRDFAAGYLAKAISNPEKKIENVGYLGSIRVTQKEIEDAKTLDYYNKKLAEAITKAEERKQNASFINSQREKLRRFFGREETPVTVSVLGGLGSLKNSFIVRSPDEYKTSLIIWSLFFFGSFLALHLFWRFLKFTGDGLILPPIFMLCGIGYLMMISFRDPLRDTLLFADFAKGATLGCAFMAVVTALDFQSIYFQLLKKHPNRFDWFLTYSPIGLAILLSLLLISIGGSPGGSDAKVNLTIPGFGQVQPSELIRILFALFAAFYFADNWEYLRYLKEEKLSSFISFPRIKDIYLLAIFVTGLLLLFFFQKDLGPALLMAGLFLILFAVVRQKIGLSILGFLTIIGAYYGNYLAAKSDFWFASTTAANRLNIWLNPWDTEVSGGEQIVQSLWSFADGGWFGTGLGLGDPNFAPAHHTDLILSSIGEELGFIGILLLSAVYVFLFYRSYLIAKNAFSPFTYLFALGLTVINGLQLLFIFASVLGSIPLSGVITPFLSQGMSSMVGNFAAFGFLLAISNEAPKLQMELAKPTKYLAYGFVALLCLILFKAFTIQIWRSDEIPVKGVLAPVTDEVSEYLTISKLRRYSYNPRIALAKKQLPFGSIYDRNGIPLASNNWDELVKFDNEYKELGVYLENVCKKGRRCYPFGNKLFHLIGNYSTEKNKDESKTNRIEVVYDDVLRGYNDYPETVKISAHVRKIVLNEKNEPAIDPNTNQNEIFEGVEDVIVTKKDYKELLPLIRNRYNPINIEANLLKFKNRNIKTSFDIRLQIRLTNILKSELEPKKQKGAITVLDPKSGDLLASVNFPFPEDDANENQKALFAENDYYLDRSRAGQYAPGSTFKLVTAMAAFRKDPSFESKEFQCIRLDTGKAGFKVRGHDINDDKKDNPHEHPNFKKGLTVSCNAYFAQLGENIVGANELFVTSNLFGISTAKPNIAFELDKFLPQSSYGQGEIQVSPFEIAKVSATIANGGLMNMGRWITDENNRRLEEPIQIITGEQSEKISEAMLSVVTEGTAKDALNSISPQIAGKTGTAENGIYINGKYVSKQSHSWFTGFAPYNNHNQRIAFSIIVENGGYGGVIAAKIGGKVVTTAKDIGLIQ